MTLEFSSVAELRQSYAAVRRTFQSYVEPPHVPKTRPYRPRPIHEIMGALVPASLKPRQSVPPVATGAVQPKPRDWLFVGALNLSPGVEIRMLPRRPNAARSYLNNDPRWHEIAAEVCAKWKIRFSELQGPSHEKRLVPARDELCWRLRHETEMSLQSIGKRLGDRDHTTIRTAALRYARREGLTE